MTPNFHPVPPSPTSCASEEHFEHLLSHSGVGGSRAHQGLLFLAVLAGELDVGFLQPPLPQHGPLGSAAHVPGLLSSADNFSAQHFTVSLA